MCVRITVLYCSTLFMGYGTLFVTFCTLCGDASLYIKRGKVTTVCPSVRNGGRGQLSSR